MAGKTDFQPTPVSWAGPRTVVVPRTEQGFGFTLRHFIVYPPETLPPNSSNKDDDGVYDCDGRLGPRLSNLEPMDTIFVKYVKDDSPAHRAGLNTGDRIVSVNGQSVSGKTYSQVINLIQHSDKALKLKVVPRDEDILQLAYHSQAEESLCGSTIDTDQVENYPPPYSFHERDIQTYTNPEPLYRNSTGETKVSITVRDDRIRDRTPRYEDQSGPDLRNIYPGSEPPYRDQVKGDNTSLRPILKSRSVENPLVNTNNMTTNVSCFPPKKSFGLYFPPKPTEIRSSSDSNLSRGVVVNSGSKENVRITGGTQGGEHSKKLGYAHRHLCIDVENDMKAPPPYTPSTNNSTDGAPVVILRSRTTSSLATNVSNPSSHRSLTEARVSLADARASSHRRSDVDPARDKTNGRHYIPVVSESPVSSQLRFSSSMDSIDGMSGRYRTSQVRQVGDRFQEQTSPESKTRTFVVRIPVGERQYRAGSECVPQSPVDKDDSSGSGTTFALTRSPMTTQIEIKKAQTCPSVSRRKHQFETGKNENNSPGSNFNRYKTEIQKITGYKKFEGVASRAAMFESSQDYSQPQPEVQSPQNTQPAQPLVKVRKISNERHTPPKAERPVTLANYDDNAPIRIFVSAGSSSAPSSPVVEIVPLIVDTPKKQVLAPEREMSPRPASYSSSDVVFDAPHPPPHIVQESIHGNRPVRKTSYLSAVNAPKPNYTQTQSLSIDDELDVPVELTPSVMKPMTTSLSFTSESVQDKRIVYSSAPSVMCASDSNLVARKPFDPLQPETNVVLRSKSVASPEDEAMKLHRRTSYLMATARDRSNQIPLEKSFSPPLAIPEDPVETPPRPQNLKKLKHFFGERTPSILEATEHKPEVESPLADITREGWLTCKTLVTDGKKFSDRSWKELWVVLRSHCLFLCKEKRDNSSMTFNLDDTPISIKSCLVDIKHDYAKKKKHVFKLITYNGSEYLFQSEDRENMLLWIKAIKSNNNPDCDDQGVISADLIIRKSSMADLGAANTKTSPQPSHKSSKKLAALSFKTKSSSSPSLRRKKTEKEEGSGKTKSSWKGRIMPKSFKRHHDDMNQSAIAEQDGMKAAFGVPLDQCVSSPHNEYVPLIVELCTRIVEARGLDVVGVYRVPGNSIAVSNIQEELSRGIDNVNIDNEKWLDVNVISSLLKAFFRKLPEPLVTNKNYGRFIEANRIADVEKRMLKLKRLLHTLPEHHFETFKRLAEHLNRVAAFGHINKMDARNLAIMFGPTLIHRSDDDTYTLVSDMSDQCRIVESVILHNEWFFSSWEDDHTVPSEAVAEAPPTIDSSRVVKDDDEDADSAINAREIMSSIITAANRKLQCKQQQKSTDSLDIDTSFNERNIDFEIGMRQASTSSIINKSQNTINSLSSRSVSEEFLDRKLSSSTMKSHGKSSTDDIDFVDFEFIDAPKLDSRGKKPERTVFSRHYSDDSLLDRNDEIEMSHGLSNSWSLSPDTLDGLRRIEVEARVIREREEQRRREKRRAEKQRIEQEYVQTKKELELEESHSVEDLLNWRSDFSYRVYDGVKQDPVNYSNVENRGSQLAVRHYPSSSDSSRDSGSSAGVAAGYAHRLMRPDCKDDPRYHQKHEGKPHSGGKYFVSIANSRSKPNHGALQGSLDSLAPRYSVRTGSLENILDNQGQAYKRASHLLHHNQNQTQGVKKRDSKHERKSRPGSLSQYGSVRHGSLDSLIDMIERKDNRSSWASTDSEDGSDLLTSLTSTFDQKLQILLNPKYKLGHRRSNGSNLPDLSSSMTSSLGPEDKDWSVVKKAEPPVVKPTVPSAPAQVILPQGPGEMLRERHFRDPSLHRKPEPKIGVACRFEHGSQVPNQSRNAASVPLSTPSMTQPQRHSVEIKPFGVKQFTKSGQPSSSVTLTQPKKLEAKPNGSKSDFRPISKSEKTEVNATLARLSREERTMNWNQSRPVFYLDNITGKVNTESPHSEKRRTKRSKRRHTVGGPDDLEHFKALIAVTGTKENEPESKVSAWEQLQPAVKNEKLPQNRTLLSWIRKERLRGSTPDLSSEWKY